MTDDLTAAMKGDKNAELRMIVQMLAVTMHASCIFIADETMRERLTTFADSALDYINSTSVEVVRARVVNHDEELHD